MPITEELYALGNAARRLNDGSEQLNGLIARIDVLLAKLGIGMDYVHPRPLAENVSYDRDGKRVIELAYVGYCRIGKQFGLAIKTVKVLESKAALAGGVPGEFVPLLQAPRRLRYAAVDVLPELVAGLSTQVEEVAGAMERRCATAEALARRLEELAGAPPSGEVQRAAQAASSHGRPTVEMQQVAMAPTIAPAPTTSGRPTVPYLDGEPPPPSGRGRAR
jgi:hypothetical protein